MKQYNPTTTRSSSSYTVVDCVGVLAGMLSTTAALVSTSLRICAEIADPVQLGTAFHAMTCSSNLLLLATRCSLVLKLCLYSIVLGSAPFVLYLSSPVVLSWSP
jgi:hypothetical protein